MAFVSAHARSSRLLINPVLLQEFPYMRHQLDHFDRFLKEIVTSALETFGFQTLRKLDQAICDAYELP
jgi:hypothetical protein